jgi:hypothetical protein
MMRALVIVLAIVAAAKVIAHERLYRQGTQEALLQAYRDRAVAACQSQQPLQVAAAGAATPLWTRPARISLAIGRGDVDVKLWELGNELWASRFKHPHIVLTTAPGAVCAYDVIEGRAYLSGR